MDSDRGSNFRHERTPCFNRLLGIDSPSKITSTGDHSDSDENLSEGDVLYGNDDESPAKITSTGDHFVSDHDLAELNSLDIGEGSSATNASTGEDSVSENELSGDEIFHIDIDSPAKIATTGDESPAKIEFTGEDSVSANEVREQEINNIGDSQLKTLSAGDESPAKITSIGETSVANNDLNEDDVSYAGDSAEPNRAISGKPKYKPPGEKGVPAALLEQKRSILNRQIIFLPPQITLPSSSSSNLPMTSSSSSNLPMASSSSSNLPMTSSSSSNHPMASSSSRNLPMTSSSFPPMPIRPSATSSDLISEKATEVPKTERVAKSMPAMKCHYPIGKKSKAIDIKNPAQRDLTDSDEERKTPHQTVAERYAISDRKVTSSMFEGRGRTLKGKDQRILRNAVLEATEFKKPDEEQLGSWSELTKHRKKKEDSDNDDEER